MAKVKCPRRDPEPVDLRRFCFRGPIFVGTFIALSMLVAAAHANEDAFSFAKAESGFRFAEVPINAGLPQGANEDDLKADSEDTSKHFWFLYGDASSQAVCLRFDPENPSLLLIDVNRNQKYSANESLQSSGDGIWFAELTGEFGSLQNQTEKQTVRIRRDESSAQWYVATAGNRVGQADFGGNRCDAKIEDKNANGLWFDPADRLLVDFDQNGKLSRLREQIPAQGMRKVRGTVWAIAGSPEGKAVTLSQVVGSGFIIPTLELADPSAKVTSVSGQLGSSSGIGIPISSIDEPIEVPVGDWYVERLFFDVTTDDHVFQFGFARYEAATAIKIADEESKEIHLLGELSLSATVSVQRNGGDTHMTLIPSLTSDSGSYMIASRTGKRSANNENRLMCFSRALDQQLGVGSSGFS